MQIKAKQTLGIYLDRQGITAVQCDSARHNLQWQEQLSSEQPLEHDSPLWDELLQDMFQRIRARTAGNYTPVAIALADPWLRQTLLAFEALPRSPAERQALIGWRLSKDWHLDMQQQRISWQVLGRQADRHWLVAQTAPAALLDRIESRARQAGLLLVSLDGIGNCLHNHLDGTSAQVLLNVTPEYWSLALYDAQGWPRYRRARWQTLAPGPAVFESFVANLDRMICAVPEHPPQQLRLAAPESLTGALQEVLGTRLRIPVQQVELPSCRAAGSPGMREQLAMLAREAA